MNPPGAWLRTAESGHPPDGAMGQPFVEAFAVCWSSRHRQGVRIAPDVLDKLPVGVEIPGVAPLRFPRRPIVCNPGAEPLGGLADGVQVRPYRYLQPAGGCDVVRRRRFLKRVRRLPQIPVAAHQRDVSKPAELRADVAVLGASSSYLGMVVAQSM